MPDKKQPGEETKNGLPHPLRDLYGGELLNLLGKKELRYLDLIPRDSLEEKIAYLALEGPGAWGELGAVFDRLLETIRRFSTQGVRTVVFGGGTGLSGILGGDTELLRDLLVLLQRDHYVQQQPDDGRYRFRFRLIQRWWRVNRNLP